MSKKDYIVNKVAVITGISKGIGRALTEALLERGVTVIGWGRSEPKYSHENLHFVACDVSDENEVLNAIEETSKLTSKVHFLINNAGFGYFSPIESFDVAQFKRMMDVNVLGTFKVTQAFITLLRAREASHIVNISSIAGKVGMAQGEGYNTSKFAVTGMSECLFHELRKSGVKVTTVFPGSTATHFFDEIPGVVPNDKMVDPEELAASILHVLDTSPNYLIREIEIRPLNSK